MNKIRSGMNDIVQVVTEQVDSVYRFSYALTADPQGASDLSYKVFLQAQNDFASLLNQGSDELRVRLLSAAFQHAKDKNTRQPKSDGSWQEDIFKLSTNHRAAFVLADIFGLLSSEILEIMDLKNAAELNKWLLESRKMILKDVKVPGSVEDHEFISLICPIFLLLSLKVQRKAVLRPSKGRARMTRRIFQ